MDKRSNYVITLNPPRALTHWKPIAVIGGAFTGILITYALSLNKRKTSEN
ncbi:hypothetical protein [Saccharolobus shibatae]|uniref:Uncharacterized protein n=1 Tax=Saccharolobus shibatae TaxID=2286 RepID=A0A8F5GZ16_9CREN|nr:hypothetical protein [Saccharolobus shibatae]QXJ34873.1 hypothetical protein J5U22_01420 [Saccharolobus shibatae]